MRPQSTSEPARKEGAGRGPTDNLFTVWRNPSLFSSSSARIREQRLSVYHFLSYWKIVQFSLGELK